MQASSQSPLRRLALIQRWLLLLLLGAALLLLVEIRFDHQAVLGEKWQAWIPLLYLGLLIIAIPTGLLTQRSFGSKLLVVTFSGLAVIGCLGSWFHAKNKPWQKIQTIISTNLSQPGQLLETSGDDSTAPLLAPLSLVGLGVMGILISLWRADERDVEPPTRTIDKGDL